MTLSNSTAHALVEFSPLFSFQNSTISSKSKHVYFNQIREIVDPRTASFAKRGQKIIGGKGVSPPRKLSEVFQRNPIERIGYNK